MRRRRMFSADDGGGGAFQEHDEFLISHINKTVSRRVALPIFNGAKVC